MHSVADRYKAMLADLSQRVRFVCLETADGRYMRVMTATGIAVLTLSRTMAIEAGIGPDNRFFTSLSKRSLRATKGRAAERCTTRQEVGMSSIEPIRWAHPDIALDALKLLLKQGEGRVENVIVRRWCNPHFPPRHRERYVVAEYVIRNGIGVFIDVASRRLLYPSGWILARA